MDSLAPLGKDQLAYLRRRAARDGRTEQRPGTSGPSGAVCRIFEFSSLPQGHGSSEMVDGPRGMARLYTNSKKSKWRLRETLTFPDGAIVDGAAPGERVVSINLPPGASRLVVARQGSRGDRRRGCQPRYTYTLVDLLVREFVRATWSQHATSPGSADTANCDAITSDTAKLSVGDGCSIIAGGAGDPGRCAEGSAQSRAPQFVDAEFPPELASLAPDGHSKQVEWEGIVWKRPPEIFGDRNFCLFDEAIVPNDIIQGHASDCWLLAALSSLAEQPHRVRRLLLSTSLNNQGKYVVVAHKHGRTVEVVIDDYFPCWRDGGPVFCYGQRNQLWPMLIEKAWAKLHGSYEALDRGGDPGRALEDLVAAPNMFYSLGPAGTCETDIDELWSRLVAANTDGFAINCTVPKPKTPSPPDVGLRDWHVYSVLDVRELDAGDAKLLKLRNPYGVKTWKGRWCHGGPEWTDKIRRELHCTDDDYEDGNFWMCIEDWTKFFGELSIVGVRDGWRYTHCDAAVAAKYPGEVVDLSLVEASTVVISLHQADKRSQTDPSYRYGGVVCELFQIFESKWKFITSSKAVRRRTVSTELELAAGNYCLTIHGTFKESVGRGCVVGCYAPSEAHVRLSRRESGACAVPALIDAVARCGQPVRFRDCEPPTGIHGSELMFSSGVAFVWTNHRDDFVFEVKMSFVRNNVQISHPAGNESVDCYIVRVPPRGQRLVHLYVSDIGKKWSYNYSFTFRMDFNHADAIPWLVERTKSDGKPSSRRWNGKASGIVCRTWPFDCGVCKVYEVPAGSRYRLMETLRFTTFTNMELVGEEDHKAIAIDLGPGESSTIVARQKSFGKFRYNTQMTYRLTELKGPPLPPEVESRAGGTTTASSVASDDA